MTSNLNESSNTRVFTDSNFLSFIANTNNFSSIGNFNISEIPNEWITLIINRNCLITKFNGYSVSWSNGFVKVPRGSHSIEGVAFFTELETKQVDLSNTATANLDVQKIINNYRSNDAQKIAESSVMIGGSLLTDVVLLE